MSKIGIIAALPAEASCLHKQKYSLNIPVEIEKDIFVCMSGMGRENAYTSAETLLNTHQIDALVSWGVAGAIDSKMHSGDLVIADEIIDDKTAYNTTMQWVNRLGSYLSETSISIYTGKIATTNSICSTSSDKQRLLENTGAFAVDMESAAIAAFTKQKDIDFIALRVIADDADTTIPAVVSENTDELGHPSPVSFSFSCIKQPGQIIDLIQLARCYRKALTTLKKIAPDLKRQHFLYNS